MNSTNEPNCAIDGLDEVDGAADDAWRQAMQRRFLERQQRQANLTAQDEVIQQGLRAGTTPAGLLTKKQAWFRAAALGDLNSIQHLAATVHLHGGINGAEASSGLTALGLAASSGHLPILQWLLEQDAWPHYGGQNSQTPLQLAIEAGQAEVADWLIEHAADLNKLDQNGIGPLHAAAQTGNLAIAKRLIEHGAIAYGGTPDGIYPAWSTLLIAIRHGHLAIVQLVVAAGVEIPATCPDGRSTRELAAQSGNADLVSWLESRF